MSKIDQRRTASKTRWGEIQRRAFPAALGILFAVFILSAFIGIYLASFQKMVLDDSAAYLNEISDRLNTSTIQALDSMSTQLSTVSQSLSSIAPYSTQRQTEDYLREQSASLGSSTIALVDSKGIWHFDGQEKKYPSLNEQLTRCVTEQAPSMSQAVNVDGTDCVVFFCPVENVIMSGRTIQVLAAFFSLDTMDGALSLSTFGDAGFADLFTPVGGVVVRSSHPGAILTGYNLFATLENAQFDAPDSLDRLRADFSAGSSGTCRYELAGRSYVSYYSRLSNQEWMLFSTVPTEVLEVRSRSFLSLTLVACLGISVLITALMGGLLIQQRRNKHRVEQVAYVDQVTGGATRGKFVLDVQAMLSRRDESWSIVYLNVDRFKLLNDRFGAQEADKLLWYIGQTLTQSLLPGECAGRLMADHFGVLLATSDADIATHRLQDWSHEIDAYPHAVDNRYTISLSCGVYLVDDPNLSVDLMIDRANLACRVRRVADSPSLSLSFYDDTLREAMRLEKDLEDRMEAALAGGEFQMYLQPQYGAESEKITSFEALCRWQPKAGPMIYPDQFIPLFERNGFIVKLDLYMFEQVCVALGERLHQGKRVVPIAFNISRVHMVGDVPLAPYLETWKKYGTDPQYLEFEFTESTIYDNVEQLGNIIEALHGHGFFCSMDDFGSGYSSLNALDALCLDQLKLDKQFFGRDGQISERNQAILSSMVDMAKRLKMDVVAEGVEHASQAEFMRQCGCDRIQGYYYAKPMPAKDAFSLLDQESTKNGEKS